MNKKFFIILLLFKINVFLGQSTDQIFIKNIYEEYNKSSKMINKRINKAIKKTKYLKNKDFKYFIVYSININILQIQLNNPELDIWQNFDSLKYKEIIDNLFTSLGDMSIILYNDTNFIGEISFYYKKNFNFYNNTVPLFSEWIYIYKYLKEFNADFILEFHINKYFAIKNNKLYFIYIDTYIDKNSRLSQIKPLFEKNTVKVYEYDQIKNIPLGSP